MFEQWVGWEYNDSKETTLFFNLLQQHKHTLKNQAKHLFCIEGLNTL